jgi:hypothetical protein
MVTGAVAVTVALVAVGLGAAQPAWSATTGSSAADQRCTRPLPPSAIGDPGVRGGASSGARVWHDAAGWHLRFTHPGTGTRVFTGVVTSGQPITAHGFRFEKQDSFRLSHHGRRLTFTVTNHGGIDGIDFTDRCAVNTAFSLTRDGRRLPVTDVGLGARQVHPTGNPFLVQRLR